MPLCTKIVESCETDAVVGSLNQMHMNRCRLSCACEKLYADVNQRAVTTAAFAHFIQHAATTPPVLNPSFPKAQQHFVTRGGVCFYKDKPFAVNGANCTAPVPDGAAIN